MEISEFGFWTQISILLLSIELVKLVMNFLNKEAILSANDAEYEEIEVPQWGGIVRMRTLTGTERDRFESYFIEEKDGAKKTEKNLRAKLLQMVIIGEDGKQLFTEKEIHLLGQKSGKILGNLFYKAQRMNGMTKEDMQELMGNSKEDQTEDSTID